MPNASEPPDKAISSVLNLFHAGNINLDQACRDLTKAFGGDGDELTRHLSVLLSDVRGRRITIDEACRDLSRAATAARKGEPNFLVFLAPVHA